MSQRKDPNQGEGDRLSARRYDRHVREFIAEGKVPKMEGASERWRAGPDAADEARLFVERDPDDAAKAERAAKRGPSGSRSASVDEIVAKGRSVMERALPVVRRAAGSLRARFGRK